MLQVHNIQHLEVNKSDNWLFSITTRKSMKLNKSQQKTSWVQ